MGARECVCWIVLGWLPGVLGAQSLPLMPEALAGGAEVAEVVPIELRGANGRTVGVAGILHATPSSLTILVNRGQRPVAVPWERIDLEHLRENVPEAYYGWMDARHYGQRILLRLGAYEGLPTYEEAIERITRALNKTRYYTLPENIDYLLEEDPDLQKAKNDDFARYTDTISGYRAELQGFLRAIFPFDGVIIDDTGKVHRKDRAMIAPEGKGETSLRLILMHLADTDSTVSRRGLQYLREVSLFQEDILRTVVPIARKIPNDTFRISNSDHRTLPILLDDFIEAIEHLLTAQQYQISEFYQFVFPDGDDYPFLSGGYDAEPSAPPSAPRQSP